MRERSDEFPPLYRHRQSGAAMRVMLSIGPIILVAVGLLIDRSIVFLPLALVLGLAGYLLTSLTVEVTATNLVWFFGPGVWRNKIELASIVTATVETNKWWWGLGIHLTPRGWLYNVAGLKAVEVTTRDGKRVRIGSDEPERLADAINSTPRR